MSLRVSSLGLDPKDQPGIWSSSNSCRKAAHSDRHKADVTVCFCPREWSRPGTKRPAWNLELLKKLQESRIQRHVQ